ncbi:MAG TPA: glucoamylase family protein, partial [Bryobacteraceae bacterium]|nr:glucoamylase family protein [Bryobacteraceae bacterium]
NERYGEMFLLFHRHRIYNPSEDRWMGWERKRGKLLDLNQFMRGGSDSFPVKVGDTSVLPRVRYVITLDADTQLPRGAAHRLVGTMAHPLHRAVVHPETKMVVDGYGILQPRVGISIDSASSSRLASLFSGQTGFDIYTHAVSDVYQDLFGEGSFVGKGIYDVDALRAALDHRFPENALLSHDLIEGAYARAGLVSDIELIDDYPSHFSAYSRRKHRWVRGDWQIMRWLLPRVPDNEGRIISNPISVISRWKILDNLRRSLFEPATLALLLAGWFLFTGDPLRWTLISVAMLLMPVWAHLFFSLLRVPRQLVLVRAWARETALAFAKGHALAFLQIVFLLHQAMLSIDAIGRSVMRVFVTRKKLLEWETAAEAENARTRTATVDVYLAWSPVLALGIGGALFLVRPAAMVAAAPVLALWFGARFLSAWLNRAPRRNSAALRDKDVQFLRSAALRTWRYFRQFSNEGNHWLIPDSVRESGAAAERLSPTNLGFLLNAYVAALEFGWLTATEFAESAKRTLATVRRLETYQGHVLNWYSNETLRIMEPRFVSTVDSGNLLACLWTLKQASLALIETPPSADLLQQGLHDIEQEAALESQPGFWTEELAERRRRIKAPAPDDLRAQLQAVAAECDALASAMDFAFLFQKRKKILSVGCDVDTGITEPSSYDLLASESRIASFTAIAKGDIPQEAWFHLGRRHTLCFGERVLLSWTGTMFEYLMPALWMKHHPGTILQDSMEAAVRAQRKAVRRLRIPWGISESGCVQGGPDTDYGYHAFGVAELAMKGSEGEPPVVSPYSSFLALAVDPHAAVANLRSLENLCFGDFGFCEAIDYRSGQRQVVRSWMAHHQGMTLLAICNLLCGEPLRRYFHAEPQVLATELLLQERVPAAIVIENEPTPHWEIAAEAAA